MTEEASQILTPGKLGGLPIRRAGDTEHKPCILIYGDNGIGKTRLACSASEVPELSPVMYLGLEEGTQSVKEMYPDLDTLEIYTLREFQSIFDDLYAQRGAGYKTIIVDNATEEQKIGLEHFFGINKDRPATSFTEFKLGAYNDSSWNWSSEQMRKSVRYFRRLPVAIIFTAWERDFSKPDSSRRDIRPAFTPAVARELPGLFNDVYYYHMEKRVRKIQTEKTDTCVAKDRTGKLPSVIENPTFQIIHDYWTGVRKKEDAKPSDDGVARPKLQVAKRKV